MQRQTELDLIRRLHRLVEAGTTDMVERAVRSPVDRYVSPEAFDRERRELFGRLPLAVAHASELVAPGDHLTVDAAGRPLLLVRGDDGEVGAFLNVCRHRGTQLVMAPAGKGASCFRCPYHAWTYDRAGRLTGVPHAQGFPDLDRSARGLVPVETEERIGLIWVRFGGEEVGVEHYLGAHLSAELAALELSGHVAFRRVQMRKKLSWKLAIDIFLEGYHIRWAHSDSIYPMFFDNVGIYERFAPHLRNLFPKRSIAELDRGDEESWRLREHANILYTLFPNTMLLIQPDHVSVFHLWPDGIDGCRLDMVTLVPEAPRTEKARRYWERNIDILVSATNEDFTMGESIQRGLHSGANQDFLYGRYEQSLAWFHDEVERMCRRP